MKLLLYKAAKEGLKLRQFDIVTAYLNTQLKNRKVYIRIPTGFQQDGMVCLLLQALYGLKQAGSLWYAYFNVILEELGFIPINDDPCVFLRSTT